MPIELISPADCSDEYLSEFERVVHEGGQIDEGKNFRERIERCEILAFYLHESEIVGVAALKNPYPGYVEDVFKKAGASEDATGFTKEIGYVAVLEEHRGHRIGSDLVDSILQQAGSIDLFATTQTVRIEMHSILKKRGFRAVGVPYKSNKGDYDLQLFVRIASDSIQ